MSTAQPLGQMIIELGLDSSTFASGMKGVKQQLKTSMTEMKSHLNIMGKSGNEVDKLKAKQTGLTSVIEAQSKKVALAKDEYEKCRKEVEGNEDATQAQKDALVKAQNEYVKAVGELGSYENQLKEVTTKLEAMQTSTYKLGESMEKSGKKISSIGKNITSLGQSISKVGGTLTKTITLPVAALTAGIVTNGIQVQKFRQQASIFYESLYQDSNKAKQQLDNLMTYAKTTPYSYESIVEADQIMQTFGMSTERAAEVQEALGEAIAGTGGSSDDLSSLATIMGQIESSGKLSLQDMNQLVNAKIPAFKIVANQLGVSVADLRTQISSGEVTSDEAISALTEGLLKGTDGINGATVAYEGSLAKVKQTLTGAIDSFKSAVKNQFSLELVNDENFSKITRAINEFTDMLNSGAFDSVVKSFSEVIGDLVENVIGAIKWFNGLSEAQQKSMVKFAAMAVVAGPVLLIAGKLVTGVGNLTTGIGNMTVNIGSGLKKFALFSKKAGGLGGILSKVGTFLVGPGGIVIGIAALVAGLVIAYNKVDWFREGVNKAFSKIKDIVLVVVEKIKEVASALYGNVIEPVVTAIVTFVSQQVEKIRSFWDANGSQIVQAVSNVFNAIKVAISAVVTVISALLKKLEPVFTVVFGVIKTIVGNTWEQIKAIVSGAVDIILGVIQLFASIFTGDWDGAWKAVKKIASTFIKTIATLIQNGFVGAIIKKIKSFVTNIVTNITTMWKNVKTKFTGGISNVKSAVTGFISNIKTGFVNIKTSAVKTVTTMWTNIKTKFTSGISSLVTKVKALPKKLGDGLKSAGSALKDGLVSIWTTAVKGAAVPVNKVISGANWVLKKFGSSKTIASWKPYARGTKGHPGGNALVNDGRGAELVQMPSGETFIPKGRNVLIPNAPKGMKVMPAEETAQLMGKNAPTFQYSGGIGSFASELFDGVASAASKVKDLVLDIWGYISKPSELINKVVSNFVNYDGIAGLAKDVGSGMVSTAKSAMTSWVKDLFETSEGASLSSYVASKGVEQWRQTVIRALQMEGQYSDANVTKTLYQMKTESGGNPMAINNWDINAKNGTPSKGLMQVIDPTFKAYARSGYNSNIWDPLSNILASIRYAVSRYGTLAKAYRGVGYANGGLITWEHQATVGEGNKPEMIIPLTNRARAYELIAKALSYLDGGSTPQSSSDNVSTSELESRIANMESAMSKMVELLQIIADKKLVVDRKAIVDTSDDGMGQNRRREARGLA